MSFMASFGASQSQDDSNGEKEPRPRGSLSRQGTRGSLSRQGSRSSFDTALERFTQEERAAKSARLRVPTLSGLFVRSVTSDQHSVAAWLDDVPSPHSPACAEVPGQAGQPRRRHVDARHADGIMLLDAADGQPVEEAGVPDVATDLRAMEASRNRELEDVQRLLDVNVDPHAGPPDVDAELRAMVVSRNRKLEDVQRLLDANADPNARFYFRVAGSGSAKSATALAGSKQFFGSVLALAAMRCDGALVSVLVRGKADLESRFSFQAGLRKAATEQPILFAAVAKCNNEVVLKLVQLKARLDAVGSMLGKPNNTLLWHACYFGDARFVKYLLSRSHEHLNVPAVSQDEPGVSHTPLHMVARKGDVAVARELIAAGATIDSRNEVDETPLTDAIDHDHPDIIRVLVAKSAHVLSERAMDRLFREKNNMVAITAAAEGLRLASEDYIKENLSIDHVMRFLTMPGDAAMHIIHIAFMTRYLKYSDGNKRKVHTNALVSRNGFNVAVGPDIEALPDWSDCRVQGTPASSAADLSPNHRKRSREFYKKLLPRQNPLSLDSAVPVQVPIHVYQCILKGIHHNVDVLHAIASSTNYNIFNELGCRAVVELGWRRIRIYYFLGLLVNTTFAVHLVRIVADLNGTTGPTALPWQISKFLFLVLPWLYEVVREFLQALGFGLMGKLSSYFNLSNFVDLARLVITGYVVFMLCFRWDAFGEGGNPSTRVLLSVVCFFRWMQVLNNLNGFDVFGPAILPIQKGIGEMYTFIAVVLFPAIGCMHAYFAFGLYGDDVVRTLDIIYRLAFIGEHDLLEMENVEEDVPGSPWRVWVRVLLIFVSFFVGLTMMNIFIAVIGEAYLSASKEKMLIFWQNKAGIVFGESAILAALKSIFPCSRRVQAELPEHEVEGPEFDYVWFVEPKDEAISAGDGAVDDIETDMQRPATLHDMDDMNKRLHGLEKAIGRLA